ncbi:FOG: WD40 repeat [Richelia intracellularis HH01]|uniref:FOG: WD40 repeat n=1 Tax=Richelia intracellularis HH01 TaxID=1165094 RepID=M1WXF1_9NOST|nr:DUF4335 domain-containing protein [Richelia intracellularis]CCH66297.1 FOG: WD40 repeat [Richelia intracellularis HH01]HAE06070.1 DUF4335 domain-containing protein [Richelia sp.]
MSIQRKYSLPNCTLILEGLSNTAQANSPQEIRPLLSILVNAECHLSGLKEPITGGREFFESLVRAVSAYAQEFLSNVSNSQANKKEFEPVQLEKLSDNQHRLVLRMHEVQDSNFQAPTALDISTVQLFDLVEAVDQFLADSQTLPEITLELQPVVNHYNSVIQIFLKQAIPATLGVSSLAAAAIIFGVLPPPKFHPIQKIQSDESSIQPSESTLSRKTVDIWGDDSKISKVNTDNDNNASDPNIIDLETVLKTVPEINNASQLKLLNRHVYNQINPEWKNRVVLKQDLIYRVGVAADGAIIGYKAINKEANKNIGITPLPQLLYIPTNQKFINNEPIAQFRIVFRKSQVLEVSPWNGYANTPDVVGPRIKNNVQIKQLRQKLFDNIRENWGETSAYKHVLKYRVAVTGDGLIADYEPLNQMAFDYYKETPLPEMFSAIYGSNITAPNNQEPLAHYQVEFLPSGKLDVKYWKGYK